MSHIMEPIPESEDFAPRKVKPTPKQIKRKRRVSTRTRLTIIGLLLAVVGAGFALNAYSQWSEHWTLHFQVPVQNFIRIEPRTSVYKPFIKRALAAPPSFEDKIKAAFGSHAPTFIEIARMESGHNAGAKGYNCMYGKESKACAPQDKEKAWSVDCGALQINVYGKTCPVELYDLDKNLEAAVGKFNRQGFNAWTGCKTKRLICK